MMKNNYPIKYAVMALEEYKGDQVDVKDVDKNFEGVCTAIDLKVKSRLPL